MRRMNISALAVGILLFLFGLAGAFPFKSRGALEFWVDGASFSSDSGRAWQEIYWSLRADDFTAMDTLGRKMARFRTEILLKDRLGNRALSEGWNSLSPMPTEQMMKQKDMVMLDQIEARSLKPGSYHLTMTITDLAGGKQGLVDTTFAVPGYEKLSISNIELSSGIAVDSSHSRFRKGSLTIKPWPSRAFDDELYYYYEIYNLAATADTLNKRYLRVSISSIDSPFVRILTNRNISLITGRFSDHGSYRISDIIKGDYILKIQLIDTTGIIITTSSQFSVVHHLLGNLFSDDKINRKIEAMMHEGGNYYDQIEYLASARQYATFMKLNDSGKREYLRRFWESLDQNKNTEENETLIEHRRRYQVADDKYSEKIAKGIKGCETDRGRIYIKYGQPDEIEYKNMQLTNKPLEVWKYNNGRTIVFMDISGFGRFQLIYCSTSEEATNPKYKQYYNSNQ